LLFCSVVAARPRFQALKAMDVTVKGQVTSPVACSQFATEELSSGPPALPNGYGWTSSQQEPPSGGGEPAWMLAVLEVPLAVVVVLAAPAQRTEDESAWAVLVAKLAVISSPLKTRQHDRSPRRRYMTRSLGWAGRREIRRSQELKLRTENEGSSPASGRRERSRIVH
jgi:hypothetical protein